MPSLQLVVYQNIYELNPWLLSAHPAIQYDVYHFRQAIEQYCSIDMLFPEFNCLRLSDGLYLHLSGEVTNNYIL